MRSRVPFLVLAAFAVFWILFIGFNSPFFGGTDVFIFRDAGCNCASHLGFVASSAPTHPAYIPPVLFADYTPGSPLVFASVARAFGCTPYTDTYYELLLLVLIGFFAVSFVPDDEHHRKQRLFAAVLTGITLPVGLFQTGTDRPEPLAIVLFFALLMLWRKTQAVWGRALVVGLAGALFLVHPYVGIASYLVFFLMVACSPEIKGRLRIVAGSLSVVGASVGTWILILHHADASAFHRFMEHAMGAKTGAGVILKSGGAGGHTGAAHAYLAAFKRYVDSSNRLRAVAVAILLVSFAILAAATLRIPERKRRKAAFVPLLGLFAILVLFPAAVFAVQVNYFVASEALLFGTVAIGSYPFSDEIRKGKTVLILLALCAVASVPNLVIQVLRSVETRTSFERATAQEARVKQAFLARGLSEPRMIVDSAHYFVYKPNFDYVYNVDYFTADDSLSDFDGLARCYMTTLALSRPELTWEKPFREEDWELIDGDASPATIQLFGHRLMRRNWSWSCDVYARRNPRR